MDIYMLRHGETVYNREKRYQGQRDIPLSPEGRSALREARLGFAPEKVYVSPLSRVTDTAAILFPGVEQEAVDDLKEMCFGDFEGQNYLEMEKDPLYTDWVEHDAQGRTPNGESRAEFTERVNRAFVKLVEKALQTPDKPLVIVAHGGTQMAALSSFVRPEQDYYEWCAPNGCGYRLQVDGETWKKEHSLRLTGKVCCVKEAVKW